MTVVPQNSKPAAEEKTAPTREAKAAHRHGAAARQFDERCRGEPMPAGGRDALASRRPDARLDLKAAATSPQPALPARPAAAA